MWGYIQTPSPLFWASLDLSELTSRAFNEMKHSLWFPHLNYLQKSQIACVIHTYIATPKDSTEKKGLTPELLFSHFQVMDKDQLATSCNFD
ncbi:hypothetical protein VP01_1609g14 [Puccinia sorghi]|uniref:Uncharacterized protein n=1 Tax=Puccinia sorghi TaxID=27349 RepID=A0A0L6VJ22_9BASI|nr:hypothetical protein VP01_1609g14 [Puccinia sorghi]